MKKFIIALAAVAAISTAAFAEDSAASKFGLDNPTVDLNGSFPSNARVHKLKLYQSTISNSGKADSLDGVAQSQSTEESSRNSQ